MKFLHVSSEYPLSPVFGIGRYVHELAEMQARQRHAVTVITNSLTGQEYESVRNGVVVKRVPWPPPTKMTTSAPMLLHLNLQLMERAGADGLSDKYDVVITTG